MFFIFFLVELFSRRKGEDRLAVSRAGIVYYVIRLLADAVFYFISPDKAHGLVFLVLLVVFSVEIIFYVAYDEEGTRVLCYVIFAAGFALTSFVLSLSMVYSKKYRSRNVSVRLQG